MFQFNPYRLGFFIVSACFSLWLGYFAVGSAGAVQLIKSGGYWLMLLSVVLLIISLFQLATVHYKKRSQPFRICWPPVLFIALSTVVLLCMQPSGYKIVMDEPVLAATSLQMHLEREVLTVSRAYEIGGVFTPLGGYVDKRPYFYPFILSLLHDFTGYRALQGLVMNGILTPILLGLIFIVGRHFERRLGGYLAVLLFLGVPLLAMNVNGAGFELLNLVMILGTALAGVAYLKDTTPLKLNIFILMAVLLAQTRYESALYVLPVALLIGYQFIRTREIRLTRTALLAPLFLIPIPLQQLIFRDYGDLWQLDHNGLEHPFALDYMPSNLLHALAYFFGGFGDQPSSLLLSVLFIVAILLSLLGLVMRRIRLTPLDADALVFIGFGAAVLANFSILMAYHWGQIDDIVATRLVLPFLMFQVFFILWLLRAVAADRILSQICLAMAVLYFGLVTRPLCARDDFLQWSRPLSEVSWLQAQARSHLGDSVLFVSNRHLAVLAEQVAAITIGDAIRGKAGLDLHQRLKTFSRVYMVYLNPLGSSDAFTEEQIAAQAVIADLEANFALRPVESEKLDDHFAIQLAELDFVRIAPEARLSIDERLIRGTRLSESALDQFSKTLP